MSEMPFQPTLLGTQIVTEDGENGWITDEDETRVFIELPSFTGWSSKAYFFSIIENES